MIVPNLLHHVRDIAGFIQSLHSGLYAPTYIFDTPFREIHENNYRMHTPLGIVADLESCGFKIRKLKEVNNNWEALLYCLDFAYEEDPRPDCLSWDEYRLFRESIKWHASLDFPNVGRRMCMAWSVRADP